MKTRVGHLAHETSSQVAHRAEDVSAAARDAGERTKLATRNAAEATVSTSKDTAASLFWAAAAGGITTILEMPYHVANESIVKSSRLPTCSARNHQNANRTTL